MVSSLAPLRSALEAGTLAALQRQALSNRGSLPLFRLPALSREIIDTLLRDAEQPQSAYAYGEELGRKGLSLTSLLEAQGDLLALALRAADAAAHAGIADFFKQAIKGLINGETAELERQRADMERLHMVQIAAQQAQQAQLISTIRELSTPIIPVYAGILVLPLVGSIDSHRATEIAENLLEAIAAQQAQIVIIDITGVPVIDTSTANHLLTTARAVNLLGSQIVLVGISAEIAQTIVQLGVDLQGLTTLANLQAGIAYALRRFGLAVQPLGPGARPR